MSAKQKKILLLTAPYGNGHLQPTRVLQQEFERLGCEAKVYDIIDQWNKPLSKFTQNVYKQMYRFGLRRVYQFWYWATDQAVVGQIVTSFLKLANRRKLRKAITEYQPDTIICLFPTWALYRMLEDFDIVIPVHTVVTDFYMHKLWYHTNLTKIFVANEWTYYSANFSADKEKFVVTGIPIKADFEQHFLSKIEDNTLNNTVLLLAGANGVSTSYLSLLEKIHALPYNLNVILICGRNKELYRKAIKVRAKLSSSRIVVHGFCNDMMEQYEKADIVVTKSGGNTVSELAAIAKPAIFYNPLYGQEMANAQFFEKYGVAKVAMNRVDTLHYVNEIFADSTKILEMKQGYKAFYKPQAAEHIAQAVLQNIDDDNV